MKELLLNSARVLLKKWSTVVHVLGGYLLDVQNSMELSFSDNRLFKKVDLQ